MSRGEDQLWPNGELWMNVGGEWICDNCEETYPPNQWMPTFDGKIHYCEECVAKLAISYFSECDYPHLIDIDGKKYTVVCKEFKTVRQSRKQIDKKDREKVLSRGYCAICGTKKNLQVDHIKPVSKGGSNHIKNLQVLCGKCNRKKGCK